MVKIQEFGSQDPSFYVRIFLILFRFHSNMCIAIEFIIFLVIWWEGGSDGAGEVFFYFSANFTAKITNLKLIAGLLRLQTAPPSTPTHLNNHSTTSPAISPLLQPHPQITATEPEPHPQQLNSS